MCGIIGYAGDRPCLPVLLDGLEKLEYRGYDSAGVAWPAAGDFCTVKKQGRLAALRRRLEELAPAAARCGIGHTRWATHGAPCDANSHPHRAGQVCRVHNGIIENAAALKAPLLQAGAVFASETDTEVLAWLLDSLYKGDPLTALRSALAQVCGSYALAVLFSDRPGQIWAVRRQSPLVVGLGDGENFLASDMPALLAHTKRFILPDEDELVLLTAQEVQFFDAAGNAVEKEISTAAWDAQDAEKGSYPHFMLKEIHEQPEALLRTVLPRIQGGLPCFEPDGPSDTLLTGIRRVCIVGCGTAYHAGLAGKAMLEQLACLPTRVEIASEFRYAAPLLSKDELVIAVSQSGETLDTLAALQLAAQHGCPTLAIVNVPGSSLAREAGTVLYTAAGPEIAVASTKTCSAQIATLYLLAFRLALVRGTAEEPLLRQLTAQLSGCGDAIYALLQRKDKLQQLAARYSGAEHLFFIGRGPDHALALEGSLKLKEISYIHSEGCAAGELKHGTISLITDGTPVIALATQSALLEKTLGSIREVQARGAKVILLCPETAEVERSAAEHIIRLPAVHELLLPLTALVPLQLFAYYAAVQRGCDVDKPRNLAKSVTVE